MDVWKPFRLSTARPRPAGQHPVRQIPILRHLGDPLDQIRKSEYASSQF